MDPIAHTLLGATLAEAGLKKLSRYATPALVIGANLPDIDIAASLWGGDASLYFRRGWTHGILALIVLPLLLAGSLWAWDKWCKPRTISPPLRLPILIGLCFLGVWSHPLLDWLNTYGVRLLMPFSDRWFYGDTLFIIDPWFWLITAAAIVLAYSHTRRAVASWWVLAGLSTVLVLTADQVPLTAQIVWLSGVGIIALFRLRFSENLDPRHLARVSLAVLLVYIAGMYGIGRLAESRATASEPEALTAQANPLPGMPLSHRIVLVHEKSYRVIRANGELIDLPREPADAIVRAALNSDSIKGFVHWMRFPYWEIQETPQGWLVTLRDLRYVDPLAPDTAFGAAQVEVLKEQVELP